MSSSTMTPPAAGSPAAAARPGAGAGIDFSRDDVRRTLLVASGSLLGFLPMRTVFDDATWFVEALGALLCVFVPAALLRSRRGPRAGQLVPGLLVVIVYACTLYLHARAFGGFLPSPGAWHELGRLRGQASQQVAENVAPMTSTRALRVEIVPGLALTAAIIDYLAVVRRSPALAGIPLLALFTICGASAGTSVGWVAFAAAGAGFLVILSADAHINLMRWGRVVPRRGSDYPNRRGSDYPNRRGSDYRNRRGSDRLNRGAGAGSIVPRLGRTGRRIGVVSLVIAVLVPAVLPGLSRNLLASAFHNYSSNGDGGGAGTGLSPFAGLRGNLNETQSVRLLSVHVTGTQSPFYLRSKVLDQFTRTGWKASGAKTRTDSLADVRFAEPFGAADVATVPIDAQITVDRLSDDAAPAFGVAQAVTNLSGHWRWNYDQWTLTGDKTKRGTVYSEQAEQADPSAAALRAGAEEADPAGVDERYTALPGSVPAQVSTTLAEVTRGAVGAYAIARRLSDYFTDPANGFVYDLSTKAGDSGSDLVDFLTNKAGFCQQYAAAMAVMLRMSRIPARVVLGYTHEAPDKQGNFDVTNHDAHAWVEAYLPSVGWLPFDPTPIDPDRASQLPYAPHAVSPTATNAEPNRDEPTLPRVTPISRPSAEAPVQTVAAASGSTLHVPSWVGRSLAVIVLVALLACILPGVRVVDRRRRLRRARRERSLEPLWAELQAVARDRGVGWSASTTPRQVPGWLAGLGVTDAGHVTRLAHGIERERYAAPSTPPSGPEIDDYAADIRTTAQALARRQDRSGRLRALALPLSVLAGRRALSSAVRAARDRISRGR